MTQTPAPSTPPGTRPPPIPAASRLITAACILGLVGMAVALAHFFWPTPLLFALFMIVGQGAIGLALVLYGAAIFNDLRRKKVL